MKTPGRKRQCLGRAWEGSVEPLRFKHLEVRVAGTPAEVDAAQALRYSVFYDELGAKASPEVRRACRDFDDYDAICDHLLAIDLERSNGLPFVVGTYRLTRRSVARANFGFYSEQEFDLSALYDYPGEVVEMGRSCVHPEYRSRGVMQLLWRGIAEYICGHNLEVMFGCASFHGTEPESIGKPLAYLYRRHLAPEVLRPRALGAHYVDMAGDPDTGLTDEEGLASLPPLIKGYLRLGGFVGDGAVVDHDFNTTDVCVLVKTSQVTAKYHRHYIRPAEEARN